MPNFLVTTIKTTKNQIEYLIKDTEGNPEDADDAYELFLKRHLDAERNHHEMDEKHEYEADWTDGSEKAKYIHELTDDFDWSEYRTAEYPSDYLSEHVINSTKKLNLNRWGK